VKRGEPTGSPSAEQVLEENLRLRIDGAAGDLSGGGLPRRGGFSGARL